MPNYGVSYPTQEEELRANEAEADAMARAEQSNFIATFQQIPRTSAARLEELSQALVQEFNSTMDNARLEPYDLQEDLMVGLKKLFLEEANVIQARKEFAAKIAGSKHEA